MDSGSKMDEAWQLRQATSQISNISAAAATVGGITYVLWACSAATPQTGVLALLGSGLLVGGAAAMPGVLLGFLFGIPRTLQNTKAADGETKQLVNTNLEQISDWLTTLLIGATLTQLVKIPSAIWSVAETLSNNPAPTGQTSVLAAMIVYNLCLGFLASYLLTRLYLSLAFVWATRVSIPKEEKETLAQVFKDRSSPVPTAAATVAARKVIQSRIESLENGDDILAWARAQTVLGDHAAAERAYARLVKSRPDDAALREEYERAKQRPE